MIRDFGAHRARSTNKEVRELPGPVFCSLSELTGSKPAKRKSVHVVSSLSEQPPGHVELTPTTPNATVGAI